MASPRVSKGFRWGREWGKIPPVLLHGGPSGYDMMDVIYKYLKRYDPFFLDPTIKLSTPYYLNDPFESTTPYELYDYIHDDPDSLEWNCLKTINSLGVVSFSETSRSLLMWAHYADEHNGMCIGFSPEVLSSLPRENSETTPYAYYPVKVNYDTTRVDLYKLSSRLTYEEIARKVLTTKSDDWIYEKEHRCIVPINWSDSIVLSKDFEKDESKESFLERCKYAGAEIVGNEVKIDNCQNYDTPAYLAGRSKEVYFIKRINPKMVKSIHFGLRYPLESAKEIANEISNPEHKLHHVELFKYMASKDRFELSAIKIYESGRVI